MKTVLDTQSVLTYVPRWPLFSNALSAVVCLGLSAVFHNFRYMSEHICDKLATLDYAGICVLIMGSSYPPIWYAFACSGVANEKYFFVVMISITCTIAFTILNIPKYAGGEYRAFRATLFVVLGLSAVLPLIYLSSISDPQNVSYFNGWSYALGGAWYIGGAIVFATEMPEKCFPRRFDMVGASHQIFHICVLLGAWTHFSAAIDLF